MDLGDFKEVEMVGHSPLLFVDKEEDGRDFWLKSIHRARTKGRDLGLRSARGT